MIISDFAIKRPLITVVTMFALVIFGIFALIKLKTDEFPDVAPPWLTVGVIYPGASPEVVEKEVLDPVEEQVGSIAGVKRIMSKAYDGYAMLMIEFLYSKDLNEASQDVRDAISTIRADLPQEIKEPIIRKFNDTDRPIVSLAVSSTVLSSAELTRLVDPGITRELRSIAGVADVQTFGKVERELTVEIVPSKLQAAGVSVGQVVQALQLQNLAAPVGRVTGTLDERSIRLLGRIDSPAEFANLVVTERNGRLVRLGEVADVKDATEEPRTLALFGTPTAGDQEAVAIDIKKSKGFSTTDVAAKVLDRIEQLRETLPKGTKIDVVKDSGTRVHHAVNNVIEALFLGAILTVLVVFLFLNSWRSTVITGVALPISVFASFIAVWALGFNLETMSLMGLSLAIGILIDDAIVVRENIVRHVEMGKDHYTAAREGTDEIGLAVAATTFSILAVFVPIGFMPGVGGQWFKPFALTIACSVFVSLFVSFSLDPMLSAYWADPHKTEDEKWWITKQLDKFNHWFNRQAQNYRKVIAWALDHRLSMIVMAVGTFVAAFTLPAKGITGLLGALVGVAAAIWLINLRPNVWLHAVGNLGGAALAIALMAGGVVMIASGKIAAIVFGLLVAGLGVATAWISWHWVRALFDRRWQPSPTAFGGIVIGALIGAALVGKVPEWRKVGTAFFPVDDRSEFIMKIETPPGSNLEYTRLKAEEAARIVQSQPEVRYTYTTLGEGGTGAVDVGNIYVKLVPKTDRKRSVDKLAADLRKQMARVAGATISIFENDFGAGFKQIMVQIRGQDAKVLAQVADDIFAKVKA
ncbi:MAG TPA: efflux RND transporter permease subunit, partial [Gemmatimonadaceae bacterium]|nr:efflux RND transporter permease subunit [Gemmatimonadaceae bacterium]